MNLCILDLSKNEGSEASASDDDPRGELIVDATACPQDIAYPTDLNLLNKSREITESIKDKLHLRGETKPRTYRKIARKNYLQVAQNRNPSRKTIRKGVGKQLNYLRRNIQYIERLLNKHTDFPLTTKE
ncbi:MAG: IS5 family transposase [Cyclobacteriaceae bacterium]|jgi:hypothetical protein